MRAIDTNLLLRFILIDDDTQYQSTIAVMTDDVLIPITVLLETGWVLKSRYRLARPVIAKALTAILDLPTVHVMQEESIRWALERYVAGAGLSDMLHIVAAGEATAFVTFDQNIASDAGRDTPLPVETLKAP